MTGTIQRFEVVGVKSTAPPIEPGASYADRCEMAWIEAQLAAFHIEATENEWQAVSERIAKGQVWLDGHDRTEPTYSHQTHLFNRLTSRQQSLEVALDQWKRTTFHWCWTTWQCLAHASEDDQQRLCAFIGVHRLFDSPVSLWNKLGQSGDPPVAWPPDGRDHWIETLGTVEYWNRGEAEELLHERLE